MFGKVFSNVIVKDRCPRCGGNLILDVYDTDLTCMMCSRVWTPAQIQQFKFLSDLSTQDKRLSVSMRGATNPLKLKSTSRV